MTAINQIRCSTAEDVLDIVSNYNGLWNSARRFWVFRGHSDDSYELLPTALRSDAQLGHTHAPKVGVQANNEEQIRAEFERLQEFYWSVDSQGLSVPADENLLRTPGAFEDLQEDIKKQWPCDKLLSLLALAQHYGVCTRLLDWSNNPLIAAYFAAIGHMKRQKKSSSYILGIWALNLDWIIHDAFPSVGKAKMAVYVVTAPRASNPNLHAQGGVFTTELLDNTDQLRKGKPNVKTVDEIVQARWKILNWKKPVMMHITLPYKEAPKLLRLLHREGIDSAVLFPGYQGVANALKEKSYWDKQEISSYWMR